MRHKHDGKAIGGRKAHLVGIDHYDAEQILGRPLEGIFFKPPEKKPGIRWKADVTKVRILIFAFPKIA